MDNTSNQALLKPIKVGDVSLKNRMVMAPLTRSRAEDAENAASDLHVKYYTQRAGAGLIISEGSQVSKQAVGYVNTAGIHSLAQIEGWKKVTDSVHKEGGKIFCQLWHVGRISHPDFHNGEKPWAPSAVNPNSQSFTPDGFKDTVDPHAMSLGEIKQTIGEFKQAAKNAVEAGFDGVEIHSSNGYLFHQFFNRSSNKRDDDYGGTIEKRAKFLFDVLEEVKKEVPEGRIGLRLNPSLHGVFGMEADEETIPTFEYIVKKLNAYNLAYVHMSEPFTDISDIDFLIGNIAEHFRPLYDGNLMINNGFDQKTGNKVISDKKADMVAYGKLFIANPDLPKRFAENAPLNEGDPDTYYQGGEKGYIDYPFLEEKEV
jgi:N-ethylmaleimide reductase